MSGSGSRSAASSHDGLISVVIPAFNEELLVTRCLRETVVALEELNCRYEVILVDDGSDDATVELARATAEVSPHVRVIGNEVNLGKGSALMRGARAALGDLVLFVDADLEVHPRQLDLLYAALVREAADVVIGSKLHRDSQVEVPRGRQTLTLGYYLLIRTLFRLPVHDTQTGLKLFRREVLLRVIPRLLVKRFAHDLEILVNVHRLGYKIVEAPVVVTRSRPFPRIGAADVRDVAVDTAAIWYRTYILRWYDRRGREVDAQLAQISPIRIFDRHPSELELDAGPTAARLDDREREAERT
ncbi:MAG TPA: glycosyltransferase [Verrucomicrobiae bacterium]|nr:glycosyltransferase [Verrucomicrobiae bacterium]